MPGFQAVNWIGIVAPAGTPATIVARLNEEISAIQNSPEIQQQLSSAGVEVLQMGSSDFGAFMTTELRKWERVVKEGGIKAE